MDLLTYALRSGAETLRVVGMQSLPDGVSPARSTCAFGLPVLFQSDYIEVNKLDQSESLQGFASNRHSHSTMLARLAASELCLTRHNCTVMPQKRLLNTTLGLDLHHLVACVANHGASCFVAIPNQCLANVSCRRFEKPDRVLERTHHLIYNVTGAISENGYERRRWPSCGLLCLFFTPYSLQHYQLLLRLSESCGCLLVRRDLICFFSSSFFPSIPTKLWKSYLASAVLMWLHTFSTRSLAPWRAFAHVPSNKSFPAIYLANA